MQEGGAAPAPQQAQDPVEQIAMMAQEALQSQNCELAMQVCDGFMQLVSSAQGGGAPGGAAPAGPEPGTPMQRKGGSIRIKRK